MDDSWIHPSLFLWRDDSCLLLFGVAVAWSSSLTDVDSKAKNLPEDSSCRSVMCHGLYLAHCYHCYHAQNERQATHTRSHSRAPGQSLRDCINFVPFFPKPNFAVTLGQHAIVLCCCVITMGPPCKNCGSWCYPAKQITLYFVPFFPKTKNLVVTLGQAIVRCCVITMGPSCKNCGSWCVMQQANHSALSFRMDLRRFVVIIPVPGLLRVRSGTKRRILPST